MSQQPIPPNFQNPSTDGIYSRNATKVNIRIRIPGGQWRRVGRVQSMNQDIANNVQVLMELGSQFAVELKKGITTFNFSIAKLYVHTDVFDRLRNGAIFGLEIRDDSPNQPNQPGGASVILERFKQCAITTISRSYASGQAQVAQNAQVVAIGRGAGNPD